MELRLPELGENIETGLVVQVLVAVGDTLAVDQAVLELETEKATVEVPSTSAGVVREIKVSEGDEIAVGQVILTIEDETRPEPAPEPPPDDPQPEAGPSDPAPSASAAETRAPASADAGSPARPAAAPPPPSAPPTSTTSAGRPEPSRRPVLAPPSVRRLATEIGVAIDDVAGSGPHGRVTLDDVKAHARQARAGSSRAGTPTGALPPLPDFSRWGPVERVPMTGIRRATAAQMSRAWVAPHVTQHDVADISQFDAVRSRLKADGAAIPLTVTAFAVQVAAAALAAFPDFNASIDVPENTIIYKRYVNIGVAVDTERGLLVPVLKDVSNQSLPQIARAIVELAEKARSKRVSPADLEGGTFTITNLGGIGGTSFTPIVNYPEVAILGLSRSRREPVYRGDTPEPRNMLPLSLSYDHRLIDGAAAARFLRWIAERLEQPLLLSLTE